MNERIRELAEQAWDPLIDEMGDSLYDRNGGFSTKFLKAYDQRFAELIVKECLYLCESTAAGQDAEAIQEAIRQHFGVTE